MTKCTNCGIENPDGSRFCSNCGYKLEVLISCPNCGSQLPQTAKFCNECGAGLNGQEKGILSDAVVAGDVSLSIDRSDHSITTNTTSTTYNGPIYNGDINGPVINGPVNGPINVYEDALIKCYHCNKSMKKGSAEVHICVSCGNSFCDEHFISGAILCDDCLDKAVSLLVNKEYSASEQYFEKAIANGATDSEVYFYASICLLKGNRAFVQQRTTIDKILQYINRAIAIEEHGIYYYFLAYIKYDFFKRKLYNINPDYRACYQMALDRGVTEEEISQMYYLMGVDRPSCL